MANPNRFLTGLVAGTVVGALAGLFLAPKPGKDARELVKDRTGVIRNKAETYVESLKERFKGQPGEESTGNGIEVQSDNGVQG
jgi:gas vesicle protein